MKAVFLDFKTMGSGLDLDPLRDAVGELRLYDATRAGEIGARIRDADAVLTNKVRITGELMERAPRLRFIGLTATGTDNIDVETARQRGIAVANIRDYCSESVAEHVFGVLLMLTHSLHRYRDSVRAGRWQRSSEPFLLDHPIRELSAMTLGIVGHGALGRRVGAMGRAFGMQVLVAARPGSGTVPDGRTPFEQLLEQADVISLHCPLNEDTRGLFSASEFRRMRRSSILINTARGGLVDSAALADALQNGEIAAAAVDVLPQEPPVDGDPLLAYTGDNLVVTPHIAWATREARQKAVDELAANLVAFAAGAIRNRIA